jgi:uncharacterized repeat protein (TIGR01451 family)
VAIADEHGIIYDSSIHAAFQWLLAPGGDPGAAPDVVNNSWGGAGSRTEFDQDVKILHAAGIITVFAAGNEGPAQGSILAPGSYANTIAVGASDDLDQPAWFSGRGPSPLTNDIKPLLLAPGTQTLSAQPGGLYVKSSGTSMATPHAVGAIALLLSAQPQLTLAEITHILAETAVPISTTHPNFDSGWGRLDAFAAVLSQQPHGILQGVLIENSSVLKGAQIAISRQGTIEFSTKSDQTGRFYFRLQPGIYKLSASAFGYANLDVSGIVINDGGQVEKELVLQKLPTGQISGTISGDNEPISQAKIAVSGTPVKISAENDGHFHFELPAGSYELIVQAAGRRLQKIALQIAANQQKNLNIKLAPGPSILLIDSGQWRYESAAPYYQDALLDNGLSSDLWVVSDPTNTLPAFEDFLPYDIVIWSAPTDSPARLSLSDTLIRYLDHGGNLFISGQNLASLDGQSGFEDSWFRRYLEAEFAGEMALSGTDAKINGAEGSSFNGLSLLLNGEASAANQESPDLVKPRKDSFTKPIFLNESGSVLGLEAGFCEPYRIIYLGFGLEGVNGRNVRADLLQRSVGTLLQTRNHLGVRWLTEQQQELVVPGERLLLDLEVQNLSEVMTDTFDLKVGINQWGGTLITKTVTLKPCEIGQTSLFLDIPGNADLDTVHDLQVTAVSQSNPQTSAVYNLQLKTPGQILLVDDDRFFDGSGAFISALAELELPYDIWDTEGKNLQPHSPSPALLNAYEFVLWFTGYDWHAPITRDENKALTQYLQQGGRLFLTSQDYLFYNHNTSLTRELGIVDYRESITPTLVYAAADLALSPELAGPLPLNYDPYQNFSDGVIAMKGNLPFLWHNKGMPAGVAQAKNPGGRSIFWGLPYETLPVEQQPEALAAIIGWLTDLGDTSFAADKQRAPGFETRSYTLTLRNGDHAPPNLVSITNTLPPGMSLVPGSLADDFTYTPETRQITWQGTLLPGGQRQINYQAWPAVTIPPGTQLVNTVVIYDNNQGLSFERSLPLWIGVPDLSRSSLTVVASPNIPTRTITYALNLVNSSMINAENVTATLRFPAGLTPLEHSLQTSKGEILLENQSVIWNGSLNGNEFVTATLVLTKTALSEYWLPATAVIEDSKTDPIILYDLQYLPPYQFFFPVFALKK